MIIISDITEMQSRCLQARADGKRIAFVPTMGALHDGHLSLLKEGRKRGDLLVLSIFVNPAQFGQDEDLDRYPRDFERDEAMARDCGVDLIFYPNAESIYPYSYSTYLTVEGPLTTTLEGAYRPTHFRGVTTVVTKLFTIVMPHVALFGCKDFQQLAVIRRMATDLALPVEIVGMPIVREKDGLAMSSRNVYLSESERKQSLSLSDALRQAKDVVVKGERDAKEVSKVAETRLNSEEDILLGYVKICHAETLEEVQTIDGNSVLLLAVRIGNTRLIDNSYLMQQTVTAVPKRREPARATLENLYRIFTVPEAPESTLGLVDQSISRDVAGFLQTHIVAVERSIEEIEVAFSLSTIPDEPTFVSEYTEFVKKNLVAHSVHTAAPGFIGHMTSALPYFMLPLSRIMTALNQNLVKVETSKAFTPLERQVLAMLHRLVYSGDDTFYDRWIHDNVNALGAFCSGGTIANVTALWVARNRLFAPTDSFRGIAQEGLVRGLQHLGCEGLAVLGSRRSHYSLGKAIDLLGFGRDNLVLIDTDENNRIDMTQLKTECRRLLNKNIRPMALVGIAGTTETGNIDPLKEMAELAAELGCHFHVDAAWGGPTLFSERHRHLLAGIERADSVTIDAHKQLYAPMGAGMVVFKDPTALSAIEHHANYVLRHGSKDLGSHTLEGSRPGKALLVHAGLSIIGRKGYELLIDMGIEKAKAFAEMIRQHPGFELTSNPELNILTYRYCPVTVQTALAKASESQRDAINLLLDQINQLLQKDQREAGKTFVSRTRLRVPAYDQEITVLRVVLANPLTTDEILNSVLEEQCTIVLQQDIQSLLQQVTTLCAKMTEPPASACA